MRFVLYLSNGKEFYTGETDCKDADELISRIVYSQWIHFKIGGYVNVNQIVRIEELY